MRTIEQIQNNAKQILNTMRGIQAQINLLEDDYQKNALECIGQRCDTFDEIITNLKNAWTSLNTLYHMEIDLAIDLKHDSVGE